uniref:CMRF35-like molecule 7 n=1 Tax=Scatophagus argus TaxID=75038 RepID=UPI001ED849C8|nr:CMRF35-like molecule 7 [Scatophagus argus]
MKTSELLPGLFYAPALWLFWLTRHAVDSVQLSAPEEVTAAYGGSVTVSCQYNLRFRNHTKYWCKGKRYELCAIVVKTPRNRQSDRSSIADDKNAGVFTVTMTSLRESDDDMYWCVIARSGKNVFTGVRLRVSQTATTTTGAAPTTSSSSSTVTQDEMHWWATLRWILFILMLSCLVSTHIVVWRMKTARIREFSILL